MQLLAGFTRRQTEVQYGETDVLGILAPVNAHAALKHGNTAVLLSQHMQDQP